MRKEEDLEKEELEPIGEDEVRERTRARIELEEEFDDEDLLGEATLQKLAESKREAEEKEEDSEPSEEDLNEELVDEEDDEDEKPHAKTSRK